MKKCEFVGKWGECPVFRPWPIGSSISCVDMFEDNTCGSAKAKSCIGAALNTIENYGVWFTEEQLS